MCAARGVRTAGGHEIGGDRKRYLVESVFFGRQDRTDARPESDPSRDRFRLSAISALPVTTHMRTTGQVQNTTTV